MDDIAKKIDDDLRRQEAFRRRLGIIDLIGIALLLILTAGEFTAKSIPTLIFLLFFSVVMFRIFAKGMFGGKSDPIVCSACGSNLRPYVALLSSSGTKNRKIIEWFAAPFPDPAFASSFKHCPNCGTSLGRT